VQPRPITARSTQPEKAEPRATTPAPVTPVEERPSRSLQESILAALCFGDDEYSANIAASVKAEHFDEAYRDIASGALDYRARYGQPPGEGHVGDIFDHVLEGRDEKQAESYRHTLMSLFRLGAGLNTAYTADRVAEFQRGQEIKSGMFALFQRWQGAAERRNEDMDAILARTLRDANTGTGLPLCPVADIKAEAVSWLWYPRIAFGKLTLLGGDPGLGKSHIGLDLAATLTSGGTWPDGERRAKRESALIISAEDGVADTIRPRLEAAGADLIRCITIDPRKVWPGFSLVRDIGKLDVELARNSDIALIIIDPISAFLGETDSHNNADVRAAPTPLCELAERHRVAVLAITHLRKGGEGNALMKFMGSVGFTATARAGYVVTKAKDDPTQRWFLPCKNNIGPERSGLAFTIEGTRVKCGIETSRIIWDKQPVNVTADEALRPQQEEAAPKRSAATTWLADLLSKGPVPVKRIEQDADGAGFSWRTVRRAADEMDIKARKIGVREGWAWSLPAEKSGEEE
jgi:hypothetical protein